MSIAPKIVLVDASSFQAILNKQKTQFRLPIMSKKIKNETCLTYSSPDSFGDFEFTTSYHSRFWLRTPHKINDFVEIKEKHTQNTITVKIINVRVQRLQDISEEDCLKEGMPIEEKGLDVFLLWFMPLWNSTYKKFVWETNPFVFVFDFEKVESPC